MSRFLQEQAAYEAWLAHERDLPDSAFQDKHRMMREDVGRFFRGSFPAFALAFARDLPELATAPVVVSAGDAHRDNVGFSRDADARLVWTVNDLDELGWWPFALDLVRAATSLLLSGASAATLAALEHGWVGAEETSWPVVDDGTHPHLQALLPPLADDPSYFSDLESGPVELPERAADVARQAFPDGVDVTWHARTAGTGSRGLPRVVGVATLGGHRVARELKQLVPPAQTFPLVAEVFPAGDDPLHHLSAAGFPFPLGFVRTRGWQLRRLAPDVCRALPTTRLAPDQVTHLAHGLGLALGQLHSVDPASAADARRHRQGLPTGWLADAAELLADRTRHAWEAFRSDRHPLG